MPLGREGGEPGRDGVRSDVVVAHDVQVCACKTVLSRRRSRHSRSPLSPTPDPDLAFLPPRPRGGHQLVCFSTLKAPEAVACPNSWVANFVFCDVLDSAICTGYPQCTWGKMGEEELCYATAAEKEKFPDWGMYQRVTYQDAAREMRGAACPGPCCPAGLTPAPWGWEGRACGTYWRRALRPHASSPSLLLRPDRPGRLRRGQRIPQVHEPVLVHQGARGMREEHSVHGRLGQNTEMISVARSLPRY